MKQSIKQFLKPDWRKIVITFVMIMVSFLAMSVSYEYSPIVRTLLVIMAFPYYILAMLSLAGIGPQEGAGFLSLLLFVSI